MHPERFIQNSIFLNHLYITEITRFKLIDVHVSFIWQRISVLKNHPIIECEGDMSLYLKTGKAKNARSDGRSEMAIKSSDKVSITRVNTKNEKEKAKSDTRTESHKKRYRNVHDEDSEVRRMFFSIIFSAVLK